MRGSSQEVAGSGRAERIAEALRARLGWPEPGPASRFDYVWATGVSER